VTATRPLPGAAGSIEAARAALDRAGLDGPLAGHLLGSYGTRAPLVVEAAAGRRELFARITPDLPYVWAELLHGARNERALRLEDLLRRRLPLFRQAADQGLGAAAVAADLVAPLLGVSPTEFRGDVDAYRAAVAASRRWRSDPSAG
jgi:glycerol-3-phosphate dehydrogenase